MNIKETLTPDEDDFFSFFLNHPNPIDLILKDFNNIYNIKYIGLTVSDRVFIVGFQNNFTKERNLFDAVFSFQLKHNHEQYSIYNINPVNNISLFFKKHSKVIDVYLSDNMSVAI